MSYKPRTITVELLSGATFGRGEGAAGTVDVEVEHDTYGLPFLGGKALRGLLRDAWLTMQGHFPTLADAARRVLGSHADLEETCILHIGDAAIEERARSYFVAAVERDLHPLSPLAVLEVLTETRVQTSEERQTGAPARKTLRATRVAVRGLHLVSPLVWLYEPTREELRCLALAVLGTRHAGLSRNRGRGFVRLALDGDVEKTRQLAGGLAK